MAKGKRICVDWDDLDEQERLDAVYCVERLEVAESSGNDIAIVGAQEAMETFFNTLEKKFGSEIIQVNDIERGGLTFE